MGLVHAHSKDEKGLPKLSPSRWVDVTSKRIIISKSGLTLLRADFNGCMAVVMCGDGKWGALAHLHQSIQDNDRSLKWALGFVSAYVVGVMKSPITDVLLFYGDFNESQGEKQRANNGNVLVTAANVKRWMRIKGKVIDRRRIGAPPALPGPQATPAAIAAYNKLDEPWGKVVVFDPIKKRVYTAPTALTFDLRMLDKNKAYTPASLRPELDDFPFPEQTPANVKALVRGMADNQCCILP